MSLLSFAKKVKDKDVALNKKSEVALVSKQDSEIAASATPGKAGVLDDQTIDVQPLITEKGVRLQEHNVVVFRVPHAAQQGQIVQAVSRKYGVNVLRIRTAVMPAKRRRRGATSGWTKHWKKAYVTVDDIHSLTTGP